MYTNVLYIIIGGLVLFSLLLIFVVQGLKSKRTSLMMDKMSRDMDSIENTPASKTQDAEHLTQNLSETEDRFIPSNIK